MISMRRAAYLAFALTAMLFAAIVGAAPALATPPTHETFGPIQSPGFIDCGSFQDNFVDFYSGTQTTFYDKNGEAVQLVSHLSHQSNDVNSVTGLTIHEHGHFTITLDLTTGMATITGNSEVADRPGLGVVVQDVGRAVYDAAGNLVFFAGGLNHSELFGGDQVLCDALS